MMSRRFDGRGAIVTGAASGIGAAVAARLLAEGAAVVGVDRQPIDPRAGFAGVAADLARPGDVAPAIDASVELLGGPPDVLVNAAGVYLVRSLLDTSPEEWDAVEAVNVRATFLAARSVVERGMRPGGAIVNLSSVAAYGASAREPSGAYNASKAAIGSLTRQMAVEWADRGIRVVAIAPGVIDTPMLRLMDEPIAGNAYVRAAVPLRRLGTAGEVAAAVLFAASDDASYITGTTIVVDGGLLAR